MLQCRRHRRNRAIDSYALSAQNQKSITGVFEATFSHGLGHF